MFIKEAFTTTRNELGQTKFSSHTYDDAHIKKAIELIAKETNTTEIEVKKIIDAKINEFKDIAHKAPILYATILDNIIESTTFNLMEEHKISVTGAPEFDPILFMDLVHRIKIEHENFFPLRNIIDHKFVKNEQWVLVPSRYEKHKEYNSIPTAAATYTGTFIFNTNFCQSLLNYAHLKELKPKSKKYKSNGGKFPDEYAYIEFLIIHEIMHYTQADWHYQKLFKESGKLSNWVGDLRTNYLLVKSGYEQLPVGLYSDHINYDRQKSMREMYDVVKKEFENLDDQQKKKVEGAIGEIEDGHGQGEGEGGEGREGREGGTPSGKKGEKGEKGEKGKPGDGIGGEEPTEEEMEDEGKKNNGKLEKNTKDAEDEKSEKQPDRGRPSGSKIGSASSTKKGQNSSSTEVEEVKPTFSWKQILSILVKDASSEVEETYQRPSRKSIRSIHAAQQTGHGAVKPGEIVDQQSIKLGILFDCSGSMYHAMPKIFSNVKNLLKQHAKGLNQDLYIGKFSDNFDLYRGNFKTDTATKISSVNSSHTAGGQVENLSTLLSSTISGGTIFSQEIITSIDEMIAKGFNVLIISDGDILIDGYKNVMTKHKKQIYTIWASKKDYNAAVNFLGINYKNMTYIDA